MTGLYCRVERDGKWENLMVEELTDAERVEFFKDRPHDEMVRWISVLCRCYRVVDDFARVLESRLPTEALRDD